MEMRNLPTLLLQHCTSTNTEFTSYVKRVVIAKTNLIRVNIVYEDLKKYNLFPKMVQDKKSDALAVTSREKGNQHFGTGNYVRALEDYTRSIATSETPAVGAVAYANRSACLFRLNRHRDCIIDIDRALANNYPTELKEKIVKRRQQAEKLQKSLEKYHEEVPNIPESQRNPLVQCASNCIKIECNEEYGRHITATRDIEIDELIAVEKPFASVVIKERLIHCHNCLELCYNPIPCSSCTQALFCGEVCKDKAQIYHKYECLILLALVEVGIDHMLLAVRVALLAKAECDQLQSYHFDKNDYYRSDRYKEIHCLKVKPSGKTVFDPELFYTSVAVAAVFHWLESTDLFENENMKDSFKEMLLSQLQIIPRNAMAISDYTRGCEHDGYAATYFADAILAFGSLFNHSCCLYISRYSYGSTVVFRTNNKIKKGEQCFINYGPHYDGFSKWNRQLTLSQKYFFTCKCKACENDWEGHTANFAKVMNLSENSKKLYDMHVKLSEADLEFAKEMLPFFVRKLKRCEHTEPWGDALSLKKVISHCYKTMGNKRRM